MSNKIASRQNKDKEVTDQDLFGSMSPPMDFDPFAGIDINGLTGKNPLKKDTPTEQQDNRTREQQDKRTNNGTRGGQLSGQLSGQQDNRTSEQATGQQNNRTTEQATGQQDKRTTGQENNRVTQIIKQKNDAKNIPVDLNKNQYDVLKYIYFNRPFKVAGPQGIWKKINIKYGTVRKNLVSLANKGYIEPHYSVNNGVTQGSTCRIIENKCIPIFGPCPIPNPTGQQDNRTTAQATGQQHNSTTAQATGQQHNSYSSSSLFKKTTTIQNCSSETENIISEIMTTDPEYTYWIEQQVSPAQVANWQNEFGLDLQTILNNLCFVRWQILKQDTKINKTAADYLYIIMKNNRGTVNKPGNYKSMAQLELEYYESWKKKRQAQQQRIEQIKTEAVEAELKLKLEAILQNLSLENEYLQAAIAKVATTKRKQAIKNSVEDAIKNRKPLGEEEKSTLRFYLEMVLKEKALKNRSLENNPDFRNADFLGSAESGAEFFKDTDRT